MCSKLISRASSVRIFLVPAASRPPALVVRRVRLSCRDAIGSSMTAKLVTNTAHKKCAHASMKVNTHTTFPAYLRCAWHVWSTTSKATAASTSCAIWAITRRRFLSAPNHLRWQTCTQIFFCWQYSTLILHAAITDKTVCSLVLLFGLSSINTVLAVGTCHNIVMRKTKLTRAQW